MPEPLSTKQSDDLVQRLRAAALDHNEWRWGWIGEAIDEIERLRSENRRLAGRLAGSLALNVLTRTADETSEGAK